MNSEIESNKSQQGPILVAADFSENSMTAVLWAIDLANALNTSLVLIHIVHDRAEGPGYYKHDSIDAMRPMEDVAEKMMQQFIQKHMILYTPHKINMHIHSMFVHTITFVYMTFILAYNEICV